MRATSSSASARPTSTVRPRPSRHSSGHSAPCSRTCSRRGGRRRRTSPAVIATSSPTSRASRDGAVAEVCGLERQCADLCGILDLYERRFKRTIPQPSPAGQAQVARLANGAAARGETPIELTLSSPQLPPPCANKAAADRMPAFGGQIGVETAPCRGRGPTLNSIQTYVLASGSTPVTRPPFPTTQEQRHHSPAAQL